MTSGKFDLVLAVALDRLSRDQADVAGLFKHSRFVRLKIVTLAEEEINELSVGLKGIMNALFLKDFRPRCIGEGNASLGPSAVCCDGSKVASRSLM